MLDLETLLQPVLDDTSAPKPFAAVRDRAVALRQRRRVRRRVAASAFVSLTLAAGAIAAIGPSDRHTKVAVVGRAEMTTPTPTLTIGHPITITTPAMNMISAFGSIWVTQPDRVARFDPTTGRVTATIAVPGTSDFRDLAAGAGSIWVDDAGTETVTRIDPVRNRVVATLGMHKSLYVFDGLAFVDGKLWIVRPVPNDERAHGDVVSVDPTTDQITERATIPRTFTVMSGGQHALWYVHGTDLLRFDTRSLHVSVIRHHVNAVLAAADGHLWLQTTTACSVDCPAIAGGVIEADETTGAQIGTAIRLDGAVNVTATTSQGVLWLAGQPDSSSPGTVTPYDAVTHHSLARPVAVGLPIIAMTTIDHTLWIDAGGLTRITVSR